MITVQTVFVLQHESVAEDVKLIGVYATHADAFAAMQRVRSLPGFRDEPDGFSIDDYEVGLDHWTDGYVASEPHGTERAA